MAEVLAVLANPRENSYTVRLMQSFLQAYTSCHPADIITELDLYRTEIPVIDAEVLTAWSKAEEQLTAREKTLLAKIDHFTGQFIAADKVVIAAPMWNLQFPPLLAAYIANIVVPGKTFRYTETGWEGLVADKPVVLLHVRGGSYSEGPARAHDHAVPYLKSVCSLLGISSFETILCEGIEADPGKVVEIFEQAALEAARLAAIF